MTATTTTAPTTTTTLRGDVPSPAATLVMPALHTLFRRELRLAGDLVRATSTARRAEVVADHLELVLHVLHHHHTVEDELLWPRLLERAADELGPLVALMQEQHARADALLSQARMLVTAFRAAPVARRDDLGNVLDALHAALVEHLDAEERDVMPLAGRVVTQQEWDEMGEAGRAGTPGAKQALVLGMYAYEGDPAGVAAMLSVAPPPVRFVLRRAARRAFRAHSRRVHGTPTP